MKKDYDGMNHKVSESQPQIKLSAINFCGASLLSTNQPLICLSYEEKREREEININPLWKTREVLY